MARVDNKTTRRTLEVLEAFQRHKKPMSLTELARMLKAPVSSCHGIVRTLIGHGYLYNIEANRTLYPTKRLLRLAETITANDPFLSRISAALVELRDVSGESVLLGKQRGDVVVYLDTVESRQTIRYGGQPGDTKLLHATAIGKSLMAMMDKATLDRWFATYPLDRKSPTTITGIRRLRADLEAAGAVGYHISDGETTSGVLSVAVAIALDGDPVGVAIVGPKFRIEPRLEQHAALLLKLRNEFATDP